MTARKTPPTWPTETAEWINSRASWRLDNSGYTELFTAWVEDSTTLEQLQEAADRVNLLGRVVKARHAALQAAAKAAFRVGARVLLIQDSKGRFSGTGMAATIVKTTAKYAHISLDSQYSDAGAVRVGFMDIKLLPETDGRYSDAARDKAQAEAKRQHQQDLDKTAQWRQEHVTIIGVTDEQRTEMEKRLDKAITDGHDEAGR